MEIKIELLKVGKKQTDLVKALNEKGIKTTTQEVSSAVNGFPRPKFDRIREESMKIIEEWQKARD